MYCAIATILLVVFKYVFVHLQIVTDQQQREKTAKRNMHNTKLWMPDYPNQLGNLDLSGEKGRNLPADSMEYGLSNIVIVEIIGISL